MYINLILVSHTQKMISTGINLVMTVIGFAVSTLFIVFVCTRLVCARIQLNASRRSFPISSTSRSDFSILVRGLRGLDPLVVANFPTKKYSDAFVSSSQDAQEVYFPITFIWKFWVLQKLLSRFAQFYGLYSSVQ
ncbi:uncharacterized protein LOC114294162 isoform X2 [Camellia sinensis]|uniref:uncharacterized protein LOC114294162 isoform X2 n=1 Tax=Camellia sinensis TaxID=4442 RepID=UPI001036D79E|nr:uncharacterized protein LOC114294162 isoform X2 [Camellia sinensis]